MSPKRQARIEAELQENPLLPPAHRANVLARVAVALSGLVLVATLVTGYLVHNGNQTSSSNLAKTTLALSQNEAQACVGIYNSYLVKANQAQSKLLIRGLVDVITQNRADGKVVLASVPGVQKGVDRAASRYAQVNQLRASNPAGFRQACAHPVDPNHRPR